MAELRSYVWGPSPDGMSRRDRRPCEYQAYIPDLLSNREFWFEGDTAADVADAEVAIHRLNASASSLRDTEVLARILLRAEAVASSRIENLVVGAKRILEAEAARDATGSTTDVTAAEVLGNIDAVARAVELARAGTPITVDSICDIHRLLLAGTRFEDHGGVVRSDQNWIGGSAFNPGSADFVPPPPEMVPPLFEDLVAFCADDSLPAVAQAAIAHAQFETIHPFADGNGRTGRALIHMILARRGLAPHVVPPVSLILATRSREYVQALTGYRYVGEAESPAAIEGLNAWVSLFAGACIRAVDDSTEFEIRMTELEAEWRARFESVRRGSSLDLLLHAITGAPVLTVNAAVQLTGTTFAAVNRAIEQLVAAGILREVTMRNRGRVFEAAEVIDAFTGLERQLASPAGDTRVQPPVRAVPARRHQ